MLVKRNPALANIFDELLNDLSIKTNTNSNFNTPAVNIKETEHEFSLYLAAPGNKKDDFIIDIQDDILKVETKLKEEKEEIKENYTRKEYNFKSFKRSFNLPKDIIDQEKINASYENGELIINLPKKEEVENKPKTIEVK